MERIIQRTFTTITITESWTITWTSAVQREDEVQPQANRLLVKQAKTKEEPDEPLQATVMTAEPDPPSVSESLSPPLTTAVSLEPHADGLSIHPTTEGKGRRTRRRKGCRHQPSE